MSVVYQHQLHAHKVKRFRRSRWVALALILTIGVVVGLRQLKSNTQITNAKTVSKTIVGSNTTKTWHEGLFSISLPKDWTYAGEQQDIYTIFHFKSATGGDNGNRLLDVYQDSNLPNFAINRMLPVAPTTDGHLNADSTAVSDNCTAYTTGTTTGRNTVAQVAKWQGIDFLCDMANYERNVVGTGSTDGLNTVILTSPSKGTHHFFMTYTENNYKADYNVFVDALNSFQLDQ